MEKRPKKITEDGDDGACYYLVIPFGRDFLQGGRGLIGGRSMIEVREFVHEKNL